MNKPLYLNLYNYNYDFLFDLTQSFVDIIRNSEGYNKKRLLLISGMNADLALICNSNYKIPIDPANKFAISIHYYYPYAFTSSNSQIFKNNDKWGNEAQYKELIDNFEKLKTFYIDKGIPIVIGEVGVLTEENKDIISIREYLYTVLSLSKEYNGIMACLWDTSNKKYGNMNYYNRETDEWYDEKMKSIIYNISKGKNIKSSKYYIITNLEIKTYDEENDEIVLNIGNKKPLKIIINANYIGKLFLDYNFGIFCNTQKGLSYNTVEFSKKNGKKQYDGTIIYTFDINNIECNNYIEIYIYYGEIYFNNITIEFKESFISFDYKTYKSEILNEIN